MQNARDQAPQRAQPAARDEPDENNGSAIETRGQEAAQQQHSIVIIAIQTVSR